MTSLREGAVLRGGSAAQARPYREVMAERALTSVVPAPASPPAVEELPVAAPSAFAAALAAAPARATAAAAGPATAGIGPVATGPVQVTPVERRTTTRRAEDQPVAGGRPSFRLGDVYADELERLRARAHAEGFAAGHAEGLVAAESVVAEVERAAEERLAEVQARWERRLVSATAALAAAARGLDETAAPVADGIRDSIVGTVLTLLEDLLGRELQLAQDPAMDAVRRALTFCPADAPAVVRLHPDDLAEVPAEALAELPDSVRVVADPSVERAGAIAESGPRRIDAQLSAALTRAQAVLSS
ncbi:FliH/SctL family protein [Blastococcus saxobsidens]|uniref:Flagellar assembly protein FliH n=1 Tax=Blastococcus saxobsidens TaxID=138336 RepID=A0A4Q7YDU3_9ACTN|nr:FliH/SctL family protein [Blastococcus saxobsidens]RZU34531.1 flagellar assembly protein FliH [Blastococcus saxobsidens]